MISYFLGSIVNGLLSKLLKRLIHQERPAALQTNETMTVKPEDNGMPSSHAMSLGFICSYATFLLPETRVFLLVFTALSLVYRVQVNLHTWEQVGVGVILGTVDSILWYRLSTGENPWGISIHHLLTRYLLNDDGRVEPYTMVVPFLIGLATVGSFKRRLRNYLHKKTA